MVGVGEGQGISGQLTRKSKSPEMGVNDSCSRNRMEAQGSGGRKRGLESMKM